MDLKPATILSDAAFAGLQPEPRLSVSEWADKYRILGSRSSAEPGPWRTSRTPYLREIMDAMGPHHPGHTVVIMKGAQVGISEAGLNLLGKIIHQAPGPIMYVWPTVELAQRASKQRLAPMIADCKVLAERVRDPRTRDSGNTILSKEFPGGALVFAGANSPAGLRSMPARYLILEEIDAYPGDAGGEGDPIALAVRRTETFHHGRKIIMISTPTIDGLSRIQIAFDQSDQRYYEVPCPFCNHYQVIEWPRIKFDTTDPSNAALECNGCGQLIAESYKGSMLERGRWTATADGDGDTIGFHISSLYSPPGWLSWSDAAREFMVSKRSPHLLKVWVNTILGEVWIADNDAGDPEILGARREAYTPELLPEPVLVLTAGVDVQDDRIELEIVGYGKGAESWGIDHRVFHGDPGLPAVWNQLDAVLDESFKHPAGMKLRIAAVCIDTGGHYTDAVYKYAKPRFTRRVYAIKGIGGAGRPFVGKYSKNNARRVRLFPIGVETGKDLIYSRLRITTPGPGFCHFPMHYTDEYFAQLCGERRVTRMVRGAMVTRWEKFRANEALDIRVYAAAALDLLGINLDAAAKRADNLKNTAENGEIDAKTDKKNIKTKKKRRRPDGFVTGWRNY